MDYTIAKVYEAKAGISVEIVCNGDESENKTLLFKPSFWKEENLTMGDVIDGDRINSLKKTADVCCAVARAESLLSTSDYSRRRLINRLLHYDHSKEICEIAADYMIEHKYINEAEQTLRITRFYCVRKHWGKKRIAAELMGRGYERKYIFEALDSIPPEDYHDSLVTLIAEKYPTPPEDHHENDLRIAALVRMGYTVDEILRGMEEVSAAYMDLEEAIFDD